MIVGIVGVIGAFLPFYSANLLFVKLDISAYNILSGLYSLISFGSNIGSSGIPIPSGAFPTSNFSPEDLFMIFVVLFIIFGPLYFAFKSMRLVYYSAKKIKYKWPLFIPITYYSMYFFYPLFSNIVSRSISNNQSNGSSRGLIIDPSAVLSEYLSAFSGADISFWLYMVVLTAFVYINKDIKNTEGKTTYIDTRDTVTDKYPFFEINENEIQKDQNSIDDLLAKSKLDYFDEFNSAIILADNISEVKNLLKDSKSDFQTFMIVLLDKIKKDIVLNKVFLNMSDAELSQHIKKILLECNRKEKSKMVIIIANYYVNNI